MNRDDERDALGRWLFERDYRERGLASPRDDEWRNFTERDQEEWREEADTLMAFLAALQSEPTQHAEGLTA